MMLNTYSSNSDVKLINLNSENTLAKELQKQVANAFNLFLNYKHYYWQTFGPFERDLNIIFDEFSEEVYSAVEELAGSVRHLGQNRVRIREFRNNATVKPAKMNNSLVQMIKEADSNVLKVIGELDETLKHITENNPTLTDILRKTIRMYEKHQWWLHYILNKRQGLHALSH